MSYPPIGPDGNPLPAGAPQPSAAPGPTPAGTPGYGPPVSTPPAFGAPASAPPAADPYGTPVSTPPVFGTPTADLHAAPQATVGAEAPTAPFAAGGYPPVAGPEFTGQPAYPGAPLSGPPLNQPLSGPPGSGVPYGMPPAPGAAPGRSRTVLVLALVAGLLLVLSGVMTGLFVTKSNAANRTERQLSAKVTERDATIAANTREIENLKRDLQVANDKVDSVQQDLTGTKNDRDEQQRQKEVIGKCLDQLTTALGAAAAGNRSAYDQAMKGLDKVCDEAEKYV